jgi:CDP-diacylglycerol--glycerol-3-phosphate 3-phosphatidyltransferase
MILLNAIGWPFEWLREVLARGLVRIGASPNVLTLVGLVCNIGAGVLFAVGEFRWAVGAIVLASAFDMLDGSVARLSGKAGKFGAFFDSSIDRYNDAVVFAGVIVYYLNAGDRLAVLLGLSALIGSQVISYTRARAECFIDSCKVGFFERGERLVTLMLGAFFYNMRTALWILAVLTHLTVLVRIQYTMRKLSGKPVPPKDTLKGTLYHLVFWDYDRGSLPFDIAASAVAACCIFWRW